MNSYNPTIYTTAAAAKSLQSCLTLCDPIDGSPPGSTVPGILQTRTLEWVAISFSNAGKWKVKVKLLSHVQPSATPWTAAHQAPPSMGFSRQEDWSRDLINIKLDWENIYMEMMKFLSIHLEFLFFLSKIKIFSFLMLELQLTVLIHFPPILPGSSILIKLDVFR